MVKIVMIKSSVKEREEALEILGEQLFQLSKVYSESFLKKGRGALVVHTTFLDTNHKFNSIDYHNKKESLDLFDDEKSRQDLKDLIKSYDPKNEGILILITKSSATWFVTVKLNSYKD